jgi:hypothetical protein
VAPFLVSLADLSTRCCESIAVDAASRWEVLASRLRNERLNMVAVCGSSAVFDGGVMRVFGYWCLEKAG